jgi:hypothetical protein
MPWHRDTLWRQGSVLLSKNFQTVILSDASDIDLAVAISHDCDIANDNLDAEPAVEFILARIIEREDGNCTYGKNPRTLHLRYEHEGKPIILELVASRKVKIAKTILEAIQPDETYILTSARQVLQSWLAIRYRRHALPNSLVERLRSVSNYIEKECKKNSEGILSFRIAYDPVEELPPDEPYELRLSIVYITDKTEYKDTAERVAGSLNAKFTELIQKTEEGGRVELRECKAVSEMEFTMQDMRQTEEYCLEHLSNRTDPPGPIV